MEDVIYAMREKGLRVTRQRMAILEYLLSTDEHPSARKIWETVRLQVPGISLSTVYSTLSGMKDARIIKEIEFDEMENRYEGNLSHHINLVCVQCGRINDYATAHTIDADQIRQSARFQVLQSRFELYGVCDSCSK
jgi:Fur family peroxide stress response transcriptional regulator